MTFTRIYIRAGKNEGDSKKAATVEEIYMKNKQQIETRRKQKEMKIKIFPFKLIKEESELHQFL